jgi:hypothetical protein
MILRIYAEARKHSVYGLFYFFCKNPGTLGY